ncbi:MAG: radical SAM protein [Deltaproteobacteria bacterium]|nr:radical SAM protein [Deltaproteobacteria bacterium]
MARKKQLIIPIFIPHLGCPHRCVFCNQKNITGEENPSKIQDTRFKMQDSEKITETINSYLSTWKGRGRVEVAFYGGSFTGLDPEVQGGVLMMAYKFIKEGKVDFLRVSTRPDYITEDGLTLLQRYEVRTVELGVQSMMDDVLMRAGRGHTVKDVYEAMKALKRRGFNVGIQIMPGLPGDTRETILFTTKEVIRLHPDFVRIYPTVVIRDTPLEQLYLKGLYRPWPLEDMVDVCREIATLFNKADIRIIRFGLQATEGLRRALVAGPYHPSFRQLVELKTQNSRFNLES